MKPFRMNFKIYVREATNESINRSRRHTEYTPSENIPRPIIII